MGLFDEEEEDEEETEREGVPSPLSIARSYLALAIQIGAPAYNLGDHRGCFEVYACVARLLLGTLRGELAETPKSLLRDALERSAIVPDSSEQAWIMRRTFDSILDTSEEN